MKCRHAVINLVICAFYTLVWALTCDLIFGAGCGIAQDMRLERCSWPNRAGWLQAMWGFHDPFAKFEQRRYLNKLVPIPTAALPPLFEQDFIYRYRNR
jgi:hypothetical protein